MTVPPTVVRRDDGTVLCGKGRQEIPTGGRVQMELPGGGGFGPASERPQAKVLEDLALGYISETTARTVYGLDDATINAVAASLVKGELPG